MKVELRVLEHGLHLFGEEVQSRGGGWKARMAYDNGSLILKPSSRTGVVPGEMLCTIDPELARGIFEAPSQFSLGLYTYQPLKRSWLTLSLSSSGCFEFVQVDEFSSRPKSEALTVDVEDDIEDEEDDAAWEAKPDFREIPVPTACRYPFGHPGDVDFSWCGKPQRSIDEPYCAEHMALCYRKR